MDATIVIPVKYDNRRLATCLDSVLSQKKKKRTYEIIVIENGDENKALELKELYPSVVFLHHPGGGSFSARNAGIKKANGAWIFFIDADCIAHKDWIYNLFYCIDSNPTSLIIASKIDIFCKNPSDKTSVELYEKYFYLNQKEYVQDLNFAATANLAVKKEVFDQVGYFVECVNAENEREWFSRVKSKSINYVESAIVFHPARRTFRQLFVSSMRNLAGQRYFREKGMGYIYSKGLVVQKILDYISQILRVSKESLTVYQKIKIVLVINLVGVFNLIALVALKMKFVSLRNLNELDQKRREELSISVL